MEHITIDIPVHLALTVADCIEVGLDVVKDEATHDAVLRVAQTIRVTRRLKVESILQAAELLGFGKAGQ